jgi:hypothetical protein
MKDTDAARLDHDPRVGGLGARAMMLTTAVGASIPRCAAGRWR